MIGKTPSQFRTHLLRGGIWALGGVVLSLMLGVGINALLARLLSAKNLGLYFLLVSFVSLSATLAQAGSLQVLLRRIALSPIAGGKHDAAKDIQATCLYIGSGLTVVGILIWIFYGFLVDKYMPENNILPSAQILIFVWIAAMAYQGVVTESFRGLHDIRNAVFFGGIISNTVLVIALATLFLMGHAPSLPDVVSLVVGLSLTSVAFGMFLLSRRIHRNAHDGYIRYLKSLHQEATPLLLVTLLAVVLAQGDLWVLGLYRGAEDVALYAVAAKLAILAGMPLNLLNAVLPPIIAQLHAKTNPVELEKILRGSASIASIPAMLVALIAVFAGSDILGYLYGDHFRQAAPVLSVLCIGHLIHVLFGSGGLVLILTGRGKALMLITLSTTVLLIAGCTVASAYGITGVATAAACALVLQKIIMWKWIKSQMGISIQARFGKDMFRIFRTV